MDPPTTKPALALREIPEPDFADSVIVAIPQSVKPIPDDPKVWAESIFSVRSAPTWVTWLMALRQALVGLIGVKRGDSSVFKVRSVEDGQALIASPDRHLDFAASVEVDGTRRLLTVTTAVKFNNWRGRLYFVPVSVLHAPVTRAMTKRAIRDWLRN